MFKLPFIQFLLKMKKYVEEMKIEHKIGISLFIFGCAAYSLHSYLKSKSSKIDRSELTELDINLLSKIESLPKLV